MSTMSRTVIWSPLPPQISQRIRYFRKEVRWKMSAFREGLWITICQNIRFRIMELYAKILYLVWDQWVIGGFLYFLGKSWDHWVLRYTEVQSHHHTTTTSGLQWATILRSLLTIWLMQFWHKSFFGTSILDTLNCHFLVIFCRKKSFWNCSRWEAWKETFSDWLDPPLTPVCRNNWKIWRLIKM